MSKKNQGYFLAETIIVIAIIAIAITSLYVNTINMYIKQNNELTKYNTVDGLYSAMQIKKYFSNSENTFISNISQNNYLDVINYLDNLNISYKKDFINSLDIKNIYFTTYDIDSFLSTSTIDSSIKKFLNNITYEKNLCKYRYIIVFNDQSYSTVGVDCNE